MKLPVGERFLKKVAKSDGCWIWIGERTPSGYGRFTLFDRGLIQRIGAHRMSFVLHKGPIPSGLFVCHKCDNPPRVNPYHLFLGTPLDNVRDMVAKGRHATGDKNGARKHPEKFPWLYCDGPLKYSAKLTWEKVADIRSKYAAKTHSQRALGRLYGVSHHTVRRILNFKKWRIK